VAAHQRELGLRDREGSVPQITHWGPEAQVDWCEALRNWEASVAIGVPRDTEHGDPKMLSTGITRLHGVT
jgi:hypothetical protein